MNSIVKIVASVVLVVILPLSAFTAHMYYTFATSSGVIKAIDGESISTALYESVLDAAITNDVVNDLGIGVFASTDKVRTAVSGVITEDYFRYQLLQTLYAVHQVLVNPQVDLSNHNAYIQLEPVKDRLITLFADMLPNTGFSDLDICTTEQFVRLQYLLNLDDISSALNGLPCWPEQILGELPSGELGELPAALARAFTVFPSQINIVRVFVPQEYQVHSLDYENDLLLYSQRFTQAELSAMEPLNNTISQIPKVLLLIGAIIIVGLVLSIGTLGLLFIAYHHQPKILAKFFSRVFLWSGGVMAVIALLYVPVTTLIPRLFPEYEPDTVSLITVIIRAYATSVFLPILLEALLLVLVGSVCFFYTKRKNAE